MLIIKKLPKIIYFNSSLSFSMMKINTIKRYFSMRRDLIEKRLIENFEPINLEIINDSNSHSVKEGSETHFRIYIVSEKFKNKTKVQAHQEIYKLFTDQMGDKHLNKLHAISIFSYTPEEYEKNKSSLNEKIPPACTSKSTTKNKEFKI